MGAKHMYHCDLVVIDLEWIYTQYSWTDGPLMASEDPCGPDHITGSLGA